MYADCSGTTRIFDVQTSLSANQTEWWIAVAVVVHIRWQNNTQSNGEHGAVGGPKWRNVLNAINVNYPTICGVLGAFSLLRSFLFQCKHNCKFESRNYYSLGCNTATQVWFDIASTFFIRISLIRLFVYCWATMQSKSGSISIVNRN